MKGARTIIQLRWRSTFEKWLIHLSPGGGVCYWREVVITVKVWQSDLQTQHHNNYSHVTEILHWLEGFDILLTMTSRARAPVAGRWRSIRCWSSWCLWCARCCRATDLAAVDPARAHYNNKTMHSYKSRLIHVNKIRIIKYKNQI